MPRKLLVFTGGHHTGALEVVKLLHKTTRTEIVWFGHRRSMWGDKSDSAEYREVTAQGIRFFDLKAGKFHKTFNPQKLVRLPFGFLQAFYYLLRLRPAGIVSFGGYLAPPVVFCGWLLGIPSVTHEQTVVAGLANRFTSIFVKKIALTWPESAAYYPRSKTVLTGLPLRPEILKNLEPKRDLKIIYVTGGKNGSRAINQAVFQALPQLVKKYFVIHQTGHHDFSVSQNFRLENYTSFDFSSSRAIDALSRADIVVSRAGAHIVYELAILGKPSVLIPLPGSSHHEQEKNAGILVNHHLAVLLPQHNLSPGSLFDSIRQAQSLSGSPLPLPLTATETMVQLIKSQFQL